MSNTASSKHTTKGTSLYLKNGHTFTLTTKDSLDIYERLPVATYAARQDPLTGEFYLERIEQLNVTGKLYGEIQGTAERILGTFQDRKPSTGVLLAGEKGSGKTLLAKLICTLAAKDAISTIVINEPLCGEGFNDFIQTIEQPTVVLFDEFEKVYHETEHQERLLTLLDGVYPSKKLFLFTCNEKRNVNSNMINRPGRIFYMLSYSGVDTSFIEEYCDDNLKDKSHIPTICKISKLYQAFNFDMLQAMVEEMNRYNESPSQALKFLNAQPQNCDAGNEYEMSLWVKNKSVNLESYGSTTFHGNPLIEDIHVYHEEGTEKFYPSEIVRMDANTGEFTFMNKNRARLILKTVSKRREVNFDALLGSSTLKQKKVSTVIQKAFKTRRWMPKMKSSPTLQEVE